MNVDFSGADSFPIVEQGVYPCTLTGMELKEAQSGNQYYSFEFVISDGEFAGSKLWHNNTINAKDRNRYLRETLMGITGNEIPLEAVEVQVKDYIGRGCMVQVVHEEYNGQLRAKVGGIRPPDDFAADVGSIDQAPKGADFPW